MTNTIDTKYNGWTNYETWNVALWLGNERETQDYWNERANEILSKPLATEMFTQSEMAVFELAESMKGQLDTNMDDNCPALEEVSGFYLDLLNGALREVNWHEIAKHYVDAINEEAEYQAKKGAK